MRYYRSRQATDREKAKLNAPCAVIMRCELINEIPNRENKRSLRITQCRNDVYPCIPVNLDAWPRPVMSLFPGTLHHGPTRRRIQMLGCR